MRQVKHKVFISYHHELDQFHKDLLVRFGQEVFIDKSIDTGDIPDCWDDQKIRKTIRDEYLRDSTVTVLLAGIETKNRKHIDWELYSSMHDGVVNKKSGILVIKLPSLPEESYLPKRILDNLNLKHGKIVITDWSEIKNNVDLLRKLIETAHAVRTFCEYDMKMPMMRNNKS